MPLDAPDPATHLASHPPLPGSSRSPHLPSSLQLLPPPSVWASLEVSHCLKDTVSCSVCAHGALLCSVTQRDPTGFFGVLWSHNSSDLRVSAGGWSFPGLCCFFPSRSGYRRLRESKEGVNLAPGQASSWAGFQHVGLRCVVTVPPSSLSSVTC